MKQTLISLAAAAALLALLPAANATPTLSISIDGGAATLVTDNGAGDTDLTLGSVSYNYGGGAFTVAISTGVTFPAVSAPTVMDLNSINVVSSKGGVHDLVIMFSEVGFSSPAIVGGFFGGTLSTGAGSSVSATAYSGTNLFDLTNQISNIGPFTGPAFSGTSSGQILDASYSLTQVVTLHTVGTGNFSGDYELTVPEPGSIALTGLALVALGAASRRKRA